MKPFKRGFTTLLLVAFSLSALLPISSEARVSQEVKLKNIKITGRATSDDGTNMIYSVTGTIVDKDGERSFDGDIFADTSDEKEILNDEFKDPDKFNTEVTLDANNNVIRADQNKNS